MRENRIMVAPFGMVNLLEYQGLQQANEHGYVTLAGVIPENQKDTYIRYAKEDTWVKISAYGEDEQEKTLFYGILTEFCIRNEGGVNVLRLRLETGTRLMDYDLHTRSFQKEGYSYKEIAEICNDGYTELGMIMTEGRERTVGQFMIQYRETDWQFLKRLASHLNTVLVPACYVKGVKYFFGVLEKKETDNLYSDAYHISREIKCREGKKAVVLTYVIEEREAYSLGAKIGFQEMELHIWKIESFLKGNELIHRYYLRKRRDFYVPQEYQPKIIGLSLLGRIEAVEEERVKIVLEKDENSQSGNRWFPFSTVYSSPDGAGWYCMPEAGDSARLYFPTEHEEEAYVSSMFHENQGDGVRVNPQNKIWRNRQGKEIRLTPDKILLTNNQGMSVELADGSGIRIVSDGAVRIEASEDISISSANGNLNMAAANKVLLKQGDTKLELSDEIHLSGGKIHMQ